MHIGCFGYFSNPPHDPVREHKSYLFGKAAGVFSSEGHAVTLVDYGSPRAAIIPGNCGYVSFRDYLTRSAAKLGSYAFCQRYSQLRKTFRYAGILGAQESRGRVKVVLDLLRLAAAYDDLLAKLHIDAVIAWNPCLARHKVLQQICDNCGVIYSNIEGGLVPGTAELELNGGYQANGEIQMHRSQYHALEASEPELQLATSYLEYVREKRVSKKHQPSGPGATVSRRRGFRHAILLAGICERSTGILTNDAVHRSPFSPHYNREADLLDDLLRFAEQSNAEVLYKPHPNMQSYSFGAPVRNHRLQFAPGADIHNLIDECDVMVTIGSTVSVHSLLKGKGVVLAGRNAFSGLKICQDMENRAELGDCIEKALNASDHKSQEQLAQFVARSMKICSIPYAGYCEDYYGDAGEKLVERFSAMIRQ